MVKVLITIENKHSYQIPSSDHIKNAILDVLEEKDISDGDFEVDVKFVSKDEIQKLNKKYCKLDKATDVLSFPIQDKIPSDVKTPILLGDIIICPAMAAVDIIELVEHGILHLLGYHHKDD